VSSTSKQIPSATVHNGHSVDQSHLVTESHTHASQLDPTLQQLRGDPSLVSQAHRQLGQLEDDNNGMLNSVITTNRSAKRELARLGGENVPIINIP
jgi:hypothetical protein